MALTTEKAPIVGKAAAPKDGKKTNQLKELGESILNTMSDEERELLGSRSKDVAFMNLIVNPFETVSRKINNKKVTGGASIGLLLKNVSEKPLTVPSIPQLTDKPMDADWTKMSTEEVPAGAEFKLTWAEAGVFAAQSEINGLISGDPERIIKYTPNTPKDNQLPTTKFNIKKGAIAEYGIAFSDDTKESETRNAKEGFEKFAAFATKHPGIHKASNKKKAGSGVNTSALAVAQMLKAAQESAAQA